MKKVLILPPLFLFIIAVNTYCDDNPNYLSRHSKGSNCLILTFGSTTNSHYGSVGYSYYFTKYFFSDLLYSYEFGNFHYTNFKSNKLNLKNSINYYSYHKAIYLNGDLGVFAGQELIKEKLFESNSHSNFIYGFYLGTNCEYYLLDKLSVNLSVDQNLIGKSLIRDSYISFELGLRIFF